jgi:hypothetical protein
MEKKAEIGRDPRRNRLNWTRGKGELGTENNGINEAVRGPKYEQ